MEIAARGHMYGLMARVLRSEIDKPLLRELRSPAIREALRAAGAPLSCLETTDDAVLLEELGTAYTYIFLLTLSPHESVQRGEGRLWGEQAVAVKAFLEEVGLGQLEGRNLLPDHAAVELEVMEHLALAEAERRAAGDTEGAVRLRGQQQRFFAEHLGVWLIPFLGSVRKVANHSFYHEFADLGARFLYSEREELAR